MVRLKIGKEKRAIPYIADFFAEIAEAAGVSEARKNSIAGLLRVFLSGRMAMLPHNEEIIIEAGLSTDSVVISVTDKGLPYSLSEDKKAMLKKGLIDNFSLSQLGKNGMKFEFACKLDSVPAPVDNSDPDIKLLDKDVEFRLISDTDEDILKSIRCIYSHYGYNYVHAALYSIENFRQLIDSDKYLSAIGENSHGQVVAHVALTYHNQFPGLPEFSSLVTRSIARGCGIAGQALSFVEKTAEERGDEGVFSLAVGLHPYTQKICTKGGYSPCGIYFDLIPPDASGDLNDGKTRFACFFAVKILNRSRQHNLHIPAELRMFVTKIMNDQKTPFTVDEKPDEPEDKLTSYSYSAESGSENFEVYISSIGSDIDKVVSNIAELDELKSARTAVAYINCCEAGFIRTFGLMKSHGFYFTGFLPGSTAGDFVIMQKFSNPPNTTTNVAAPDYQEMCSVIRKMNSGEISRIQ